jgi:hypothetical protein
MSEEGGGVRWGARDGNALVMKRQQEGGEMEIESMVTMTDEVSCTSEKRNAC